MSRLIRLDQTGHTELAQWSPEDGPAFERARSAMEAELARGYFAVTGGDGSGVAEHVRELPADAEIVWQLRGKADKRQVDNVTAALQHNIGLGGAAVVTAYQRAER